LKIHVGVLLGGVEGIYFVTLEEIYTISTFSAAETLSRTCKLEGDK